MELEITPERLQGRWTFHHEHGVLAKDSFRLLPDGSITGYSNFNERFWRLEQGVLVVLNAHQEPTTRFDQVHSEDGLLVLSGRHLLDPDLVLTLTQLTTERLRRPGTRLALMGKIIEFGWEIGEHTYGVPAVVEEGMAPLQIGRFTSIAGGVTISLGDHRTDTVSTYPFATLSAYWPSVSKHGPDHVSKGGVRIGSDVWIGTGAFIGSGVSIGDGAVIGARSVVTKDVPPFAVLVGANRILRFRFSEAIVAGLLELAWWNWPDEQVDRYLPMMMQTDIEAFIAAARSDQARRAG